MLKKLKRALDNEVIKKSALAFSIKVLGALSGFLLNVVIARYLGAEEAGYFFLAQAIVLILSVTVRQGLDNALVRYIAGYQVLQQFDKVSGIYRLALSRVIPITVISALLLFVFSHWLANTVFEKPHLEPILNIGALVIFPMALTQLHSFCFQGQKRITHALLFQAAGLSSIALLCFWAFKLPMLQMHYTYILSLR